jgi:TonB family protein
MFRPVEILESRKWPFGSSLLIHGGVILVLLTIHPAFAPKPLRRDLVVDAFTIRAIPLYTPQTPHLKLEAPPPPDVRPIRITSTKTYHDERTVPEHVQTAETKPDQPVPPVPPVLVGRDVPQQTIEAPDKGVPASSETAALPADDLPMHKFVDGPPGHPQGTDLEEKHQVAAPTVGLFDLPRGSNSGQSGGGGERGKVQTGGFGGAASGAARKPDSTAQRVQESGFGDARAFAPGSPKRPGTTPVEVPLEIKFKPRPKYTEEARALKIEGEVLLRVLFTARGEAHALEMVRGLGHGLDRNAVESAEQIRFNPAQRDGNAVDTTAIVHIIFQLAY